MIPDDVANRYRRAGAWRAETLTGRFDAVAAANGGRVALIEGGRAFTFDEIAGRVARVAGALLALGVEPGDVVSWQLPNGCEAAVLHHAALRAGAVANPVPPAFGAHELAVVAEQARPRVHVGGKATGAPVGLPDLGQLLDGEPAAPVERRPGDLALILFTSGTASAPKGVMHTHRSLLCELDSFSDIHALTPQDRYLGGAPVTHIAGLMYGIHAPFALGTSTVLLPRWDPGAALDAIATGGATFQTGPPTLLQTLAAAAGSTDTSSFRLFSTGGASIHTAAIREAGARLGCVVKRAYGSTEVPTLTAGRLDEDDRDRLETDGRAIGLGELRIVGPDGADVAGEGEIWARAPEMFAGYLGVDDAFEPGGWFRTGDLGRVDDRGFLRVTGRIKDIIIRGGENISALELEEAIASHPAVAEVAVAGIPDDVLGERACAFVVLRAGSSMTFDALIEHLRARDLAKRKWPERLEIVGAMPRNDNGKVRKDVLRAGVRP